MSDLDLVWGHLPDPVARRRLRSQVRFTALVISLLLVLLGWAVLGVAGGLAGVAVMVLVTLTVESWARGGRDETVHRIWVEGDMLCADGPELFVRDGDGFEHVPDPPVAVADLDRLEQVSVYPSITDDDGRREFHLVVDLADRDGERRCLVLDRRIPFRIAGELGLVTALHELVGPIWRDPDGLHDTFGELDQRRLADWASVR